ncbi:MAG TPA: ABC transporter ATP-binding protein [Thermoanaerobaculia bacterium]|jgi:ABC-2 type transport system ATP-binding protein|nr:ABC transporter ATP-binding protein [Thermoanaerobaculia bacterium]
MIEAIDLSKRYPNGKLALDALNLRVEPGEIYCLLGPKGAGKTTVINLFLGLTEPTAGRALINGADVATDPLQARRLLAFLAEGTIFYDRLSVRKNLEFFTRVGGGPRMTRDDYEMILREVGLPEESFDQKVMDFGPGAIRKLGLAVVLAKDAPALLLDEPFSGVDPKAAAELVEIIERLRDRGKALLVTLQELIWVRQLADRAGFLQEGRQVLARTREELRYEDLERLYLDYTRGGLIAR